MQGVNKKMRAGKHLFYFLVLTQYCIYTLIVGSAYIIYTHINYAGATLIFTGVEASLLLYSVYTYMYKKQKRCW